ncbi:MAG: 30S ribosomal protein S18 [Candidatus Aminicenantes bacterium]
MARNQRNDRTSGRRYFPPRKKVCRFCERKVRDIDYKNVDILKRYVAERGKIAPRRLTGTCAYHQRKLANAIKKARLLGLVPFIEE